MQNKIKVVWTQAKTVCLGESLLLVILQDRRAIEPLKAAVRKIRNWFTYELGILTVEYALRETWISTYTFFKEENTSSHIFADYNF